MIHLGDITKIEQAPFVDCITFGSPCQDLSMAGKREGLKGERSGLFMQAVRIIKEMRIRSGGLYPTFAVWENVPGAFSSNRGEDFRTVLEELARIAEADACIPGSEKGKWPKAGCIAGDHFSIAWRTFDAQYWGVPQRRRRIALVVDFGGQRAAEILFERTSLRGDTEPSIPPWEGIARNPADGPAGHDRVVEGTGAYTLKIRSGCDGGGKGPLVQTEKSATLSTLQDQTLFVLQGNMIDRDIKQNGSGVSEGETMYSLTSTDRHGVCCLLNDQGGQHIQVEDGRVSPTLRAESHAHEPVICAAFTAGQGAKANGIGYAEEQAPTLRTDGGLSAMPTVLCRAHGQANAETLEDYCPTLSCNHEQPIVFESHSQDARYTQQGDTSPACTAQWGTGRNNMPLVAFSKETYNTGKNARCSLGIFTDGTAPTVRADTHTGGVAYKTGINGDVAGTLDASYYKGTGARSGMEREVAFIRTGLRWIVRRLTPTECERLQGFPDGWTDIGEWTDTKGKRHKTADSPRYKALGNSIAMPQWWWITCKMARYLPEKATLGSLFDGIGGFPLVLETRHGEGTAVWASEIEEFPIAVTKMRFKEE